MSAERLREAAALMRSRADGMGLDLRKCERATECSKGGYCGSPQLADMWPHDAEHIASWHPAVALAVADVLDLAAQWAEDHPGSWPPANKAALAVANAYLGDPR